MESIDHAELLGRVAAGDAEAWSTIVRQHGQAVWNATSGFRLDEHVRNDVCQTVWLRLHDKADSIQQPERLVGWLVRVAHNECISVLRKRQRLVALEHVDDRGDINGEDFTEGPEAADDRAEVRLAFAALDERCRELLLLMVQEPPPSYDDLAQILDMPRGSLGPTRRRCLRKLAEQPALARHLASKEDHDG